MIFSCVKINFFKGPEFQNNDQLYLVKEKCFYKQYRRKDANNDALNNIQPLKFR